MAERLRQHKGHSAGDHLDASRASARVDSFLVAARALNDCTDPTEALRVLLKEASTVIGEAGAVLALAAGGDRVELAAAIGINETLVARYASLRVSDEVPLTDAMRTGQPVWLADAAERDARYPHLASVKNRTQASATLPLRVAGQIVGALGVGAFRPHHFGDADRQFLLGLAELCASYLARIGAVRADGTGGGLTASLGALSQRVLSRAPIGFALIAPDRSFVFVNDEFASITGLPVQDHAGRRVDEVLPALTAGASVSFNRLLSTDQTVIGVEVRGTTAAEPDIEHEWLVSYFPVQDGDGITLGIGATVVEMTERNRLEAELRRSLEEEATSATHRLAEATDRIEREHASVELLQRAILPILPTSSHIALEGLYLPAGSSADVGGDWYDAFALPNDRIAVAIGDVSGHGVEAAAMMALLRNALRAYARLAVNPAQAIEWLSELLDAERVEEFATCVFAVYDTVTRSFAWVRAGHPYPLLFDAGGARFLDQRGGPPLGVVRGHRYRIHSTILEPGQRVLLYTDGLVERRGESIDTGLERLRAFVASMPPDATDIADTIVNAQLTVAHPLDDVCVLLMSVPPT